MKLTLLGTGCPSVDHKRFGPSNLITTNKAKILVDCGSGITQRLHQLKVSSANIDALLFTHLHSDHAVDLYQLIISSWHSYRIKPWKIYGPKGTKKMTSKILEAYKADIDYRIDGLEPANKTGWKVEAVEVNDGLVYKDEFIEVIAFKVNHGSWTNAYGYKFITEDKTIVISGDTAPSEKLIEISKGADILVHEVYSQSGFNRRNEVWQKYHASHHTSTIELAEIANKAKPKLLVLTHILFWGSTEEEILKEIQSAYPGEVSIGEDLSVY